MRTEIGENDKRGYVPYLYERDCELIYPESNDIFLEGEEIEPGILSSKHSRGRDRIKRYFDLVDNKVLIAVVILATFATGIYTGYSLSSISSIFELTKSNPNLTVLSNDELEKYKNWKLSEDLKNKGIWITNMVPIPIITKTPLPEETPEIP